jgi:hypothetical protein
LNMTDRQLSKTTGYGTTALRIESSPVASKIRDGSRTPFSQLTWV